MTVVHQAGGVVLLGVSVVLRRTRAGELVFPKGHIEVGETAEAAACREVAEETGLWVRVLEPLGQVQFERRGRLHRVEMFLLQADAGSPDWPAHRDVDALAFAVEAVGGALSFENLRKFWREARPRVEERLSEAR